MQPQGERAPAAHEHAADAAVAVSVATAATNDGWLAAAAHVFLTTAASHQLAKRPQSLQWLPAEA